MAMATITLDRNDLGQILDGLTQRMESYDHTAEFLDDENQNLDGFLIEEVRDSAEARNLARHYRRIIEDITRQLPKPT
jgi:hypothetical protein